MINIHDSTYIFLLISFLSGYFEYVYILLLVIFIHEYGHYFFSLLMNLKIKNIVIYPLGGITILNEKLNISILKEFFSLLGGITFQLLFYFLILKLYNLGYITNHVYYIFNKINYILISFNFMPIIPLDGGRLLNLIFNLFLPYKTSNKIMIFISLLFSIIFILYFRTFISLIIFIYLIIYIYKEYKNIELKYRVFLYERYSYSFNFKKIKFIKNINNFYRGYYHFINNVSEKDILFYFFK